LWKLGRRLLETARRLTLFPLGFLGLLLWSLVMQRSYRVATLPMTTIGGLAVKLDTLLRRKLHTSHRPRYLFVRKGGEIANTYFFELIQRRLMFIEATWLAVLLEPVGEIPSHLNMLSELTYPSKDELGRYPPLDWFAPHDHARGRELLANMGIASPGAWYVCFFARDNVYSQQNNQGTVLDRYVAYHSCRNSEIAAQVASMKFILDRGGYVIRIGSTAALPVPFAHQHLIDYPFSDFRSDFADVYLVCHARFLIGDASGIVDLSSIVDMPLGWINQVFYYPSVTRKNTICIPKLIREIATGRIVTIAEFYDLLPQNPDSLIESVVDKLNERGLAYEDNSEDDILAVTMAMYYQFVEHAPPPDGVAAYSQADAGEIWPAFIERYPELRG
jgi:putative glycosyltransferase (TIGR04372 family)